jgi:alanine-glyoxylate transaminase / serine-glyoxylate transaminase / serine-pyruvate transaminase
MLRRRVDQPLAGGAMTVDGAPGAMIPAMSGRGFMQLPGPSNVPERVQRAMAQPMFNNRGSKMPPLHAGIVGRLQRVFGTERADVLVFAGSGHAAMEAAVVNTIAPGERAIAFSCGFFGMVFADILRRFGAETEIVELAAGEAITPALVVSHLARDPEHRVKAITVVHNETSTGVTSDIGAIARAVRDAGHPALILVDMVSSLASIESRFDDWGIDVAIAGSQKGLMVPPGLAIMCVSPRARRISAEVTTPRRFFDWRHMFESLDRDGFPATTPPISLVFGLDESLRMIVDEEQLPNVFQRHRRLAEAVRRAMAALGLALVCRDRARVSDTVTAVVMPEGVDGNRVIDLALDRFGLEVARGLHELAGRVIRIGHMGWLNELEVIATIAGLEMAMVMAGASVVPGVGVAAAQRYLLEAR